MKSENETRLIGHIGVDAGLCWIGDPCYLSPESGNSPFENWGSFCDNLGKDNPTAKSFNYTMGHEGLGVCVSTGFGDGMYPVHAVIEDYKDWGKRVKSVTITFIDDDDEDDDDEYS